jgi:hypothetical protein
MRDSGGDASNQLIEEDVLAHGHKDSATEGLEKEDHG